MTDLSNILKSAVSLFFTFRSYFSGVLTSLLDERGLKVSDLCCTERTRCVETEKFCRLVEVFRNCPLLLLKLMLFVLDTEDMSLI